MINFRYQILLLLTVTGLFYSGCSSIKGGKASLNRPADIDLTHWKVTIPTPRDDGKAMEVSPPEIFDYQNIDVLKKFMYADSTDASIVFHAEPGSTTANTKYSRSELREQMVSGSNSTNWTFPEGRRMKFTMAIDNVSNGTNGKHHRMIIAQIHGRLSNEQKELIGQKDNNAPPVLKIYYQENKIYVRTKVLKNRFVDDRRMLMKDAWEDDRGYYFDRRIERNDKFTLEIIASDGKLEIILDEWDRKVYESEDLKKWGAFENYYKVGNYLQTRDKWAFGSVKIFDLEVGNLE